jgi:hypothetical protein
MHSLEKIKIRIGRLECNYLVLKQYLYHKKYITNELPSSFVVGTFCYYYPIIDFEQAFQKIKDE